MADCIDLAARYGTRFRIGYEADGVTKHAWPAEDRAWLREIRCLRGVIYPRGGDWLVACTTGHYTAAKLIALVGAAQCQGATRENGELRASFHVDQAEAVFAIMQPRKRRQLTDEQKTRLRQAGEHYRFKPDVRMHGAQERHATLETSESEQDIPTGRVGPVRV